MERVGKVKAYGNLGMSQYRLYPFRKGAYLLFLLNGYSLFILPLKVFNPMNNLYHIGQFFEYHWI